MRNASHYGLHGGLDLKIITILGLASLAISALAQVDPARTVAVVNGEEIKGSEYYRRMEYLPGVGKRQGNSFAEFPPGFLTIEQLITEKLVLQLAKQRDVYPTDIELQAEYRNRLEDNPQLLETWKSSGRNESELLGQIRFELAQFKLQTAGITITDQEVERDYKERPNTYTIPTQYKLRVVVVDNDDAKSVVDKALAAGTAFDSVAKQYSVDVTKASGGDFGTVPLNMLGSQLKTAIQGVKAGQLTQWIQSGSSDSPGFARFKVEQIIPETKLVLDAKLKRRIRRELMLIRATKNDLEKDMRDMRTKAKIDIKQPEFASAYKAFIDAYLGNKK